MVTTPDNPGRRIITGLGVLLFVLLVASFTCAIRPTQPLAVSYEAVPDGQGGAIIVWQSGKKVVAQRLSSTGQFLWPAPALLGGDVDLPPSPPTGRPPERSLGVAADGQGGAFVAAYVSGAAGGDAPSTLTGVLQHVNANGDVSVWGASQKPSAYRAGNVTPTVKTTGDSVYLFDRGLVVKYSRTGEVTWRQPLAYGEVILDNEGNIFTTWKVDDYLGNAAVSVAAYSSSGKTLWTREEKTESFNGGIPGHVPGASTGSARLALTPNGPLVRVGAMDWAIQNAEGQGPPIHVGWDTGGVLEDVVAEAGPSGDILFVLYGSNSTSRSTSKVINQKGQLVDVLYGSGGSAIILQGLNVDAGTWQQTVAVTEDGDRAEPKLVSDESGYLIVWRQWRKDPRADGTVWLQGINTDGSIRWREPVQTFPDWRLRHQSYPVILTDGSGGAIVLTNTGNRARQAPEIRAQHVSPSGQLLWGPQGILVTQP